ncbi:MAG: hypothetical protein R3B90_10335 [Planctomycetaceae bacterium]
MRTLSCRRTPPSPEVVGLWIGEWGAFNPAENQGVDEIICKHWNAK